MEASHKVAKKEGTENVRFPRGRLASMETHPIKARTVQATVYFLKAYRRRGARAAGWRELGLTLPGVSEVCCPIFEPRGFTKMRRVHTVRFTAETRSGKGEHVHR